MMARWVRKVLLCLSICCLGLCLAAVYRLAVPSGVQIKHQIHSVKKVPREVIFTEEWNRNQEPYQADVHQKRALRSSNIEPVSDGQHGGTCNETVCSLPNTKENTNHQYNYLQSRCHISSESVKHIHNFVFFIGYPRSGHSIVASFLDSHPHIIVAHEFSLFSWWPEYKTEHPQTATNPDTRLTLFNLLSKSSYWESQEGERSGKYVNKGYNLNTSSPWHGKCDGYLQVIGDKRAGGTCEAYLDSPKEFERNYQELMKLVNLPLRVIHVVRNPYDLIATSMLYESARIKNGGKVSGANANFVTRIKTRARASNYQVKHKNDRALVEAVRRIMNLAQAVTNLTALFGKENVLELHNCDMVTDPPNFIKQLCDFHSVDCSKDYVQTCTDKVFKQISRSRDYIHWPPQIVKTVNQQKQNFPFFRRYSFDSDC